MNGYADLNRNGSAFASRQLAGVRTVVPKSCLPVFVCAFLGCAITCPQRAHAGGLLRLIWGSSRNQVDAQALLADYQSRSYAWKDIVDLVAGYPRIVESDTAEADGARARLVVLGDCSDDAAAKELLRFIKGVEPGSAAIPVLASGTSISCPTFVDDWELMDVVQSRSGALRLTATVLGYSFKIPGLREPNDQGNYSVFVSLHGDVEHAPNSSASRLLDWQPIIKTNCSPPAVSAVDGGFLISDNCITSSCTQPERTATDTRWFVSDGKLASRSKQKIIQTRICDR